MNWGFFDRRVCLTTLPEEWAKAEREFARVDLTVDKFQSLPIDNDKILGPHQSFSGSVRQILIEFLESDNERLLHLEDDCVFRPNLWHLPYALNQLPADWDILYLGANLVLWEHAQPFEPERYSGYLYRVRSAWTTHAIGFNKKVIPYILEHQPDLSERMIDNWLSDQLPHLKAYCIAPMIAYQRPRHSSIWNRFDDYTPIFEASEAKLR